MRRFVLSAAFIVGLGTIAAFPALRGLSVAAAEKNESREKVRAKDEEALRKAVTDYSAAFNKGDLKAVMSCWSNDAEFVNEFGKPVRGKEALGALILKVFKEHPGATLKTTIKSTRFIKPDVATQQGIVTLALPNGSADTGPYSSIWVKRDDKWQLAQVWDLPREGLGAAHSNFESLKQLDWLVGDWASDGEEHQVSMSCKWNKNQNYLVIDQSIRLKDEEVLDLTHIIGWDPLHQQIRCWVFNSHGGFGEGMWARSGNEWLVESSGVLADGREGSSRSTWKYLDENAWQWSSTDREIDGKPMPDLKVKYVRRQPTKSAAQ